jgi:WD40 repeat protein
MCGRGGRSGKRAVSALDGTLEVWDLETGMLITTFTCDAAVFCCAFAANQTIVAGDAVGRVHFLALEGIVGDTRW